MAMHTCVNLYQLAVASIGRGLGSAGVIRLILSNLNNPRIMAIVGLVMNDSNQ